ncbi:MAG: hypothetical protein COB53_12275 [Elusimicrobia bacterium]|nr:MAG: hypothetical protein COB53_12275 [Elusimicrobiota bacterium]
MTQLFSIITLSLNLNAAPAAAQMQTCVWPNTCIEAVQTVEVKELKNDYEICVWPRKCGAKGGTTGKKAPVAQVTTCQWPNTCGKETAAVEIVAQFQPCVWPNTCSGKEIKSLLAE